MLRRVRQSAFADFDGARAVRFVLPEIVPNGAVAVSVPGVFPAGSVGDVVVRGVGRSFGRRWPSCPDAKTSAAVSVLGGDLSLKLVVNGSDKPRSALFGERLKSPLATRTSRPRPCATSVSDPGRAAQSATRTTATAAAMLVDWMRIEGPSGTKATPLQAVWAKGTPGWIDRLFAQRTGSSNLRFRSPGPLRPPLPRFVFRPMRRSCLRSSTRTVRSAPVDVG